MRKTVTSREEILQRCEQIVLEDGLTAVDIRTVASACHVSVGSIYNHFGSKDELIYAVLSNGWQKIFDIEGELNNTDNFIEYVKEIYLALSKKKQENEEFFNYYSVGLAYKDPDLGTKLFHEKSQALRDAMKAVYKQDPQMRQDIQEDVLNHYISLLVSVNLTVLMNGLVDKPSLEWILTCLLNN